MGKNDENDEKALGEAIYSTGKMVIYWIACIPWPEGRETGKFKHVTC